MGRPYDIPVTAPRQRTLGAAERRQPGDLLKLLLGSAPHTLHRRQLLGQERCDAPLFSGRRQGQFDGGDLFSSGSRKLTWRRVNRRSLQKQGSAHKPRDELGIDPGNNLVHALVDRADIVADYNSFAPQCAPILTRSRNRDRRAQG